MALWTAARAGDNKTVRDHFRRGDTANLIGLTKKGKGILKTGSGTFHVAFVGSEHVAIGGCTPLQLAVVSKKRRTVEFMLAVDTTPSLDLNVQAMCGGTAYEMAIANGLADIAAIFRRKHPNIMSVMNSPSRICSAHRAPLPASAFAIGGAFPGSTQPNPPAPPSSAPAGVTYTLPRAADIGGGSDRSVSSASGARSRGATPPPSGELSGSPPPRMAPSDKTEDHVDGATLPPPLDPSTSPTDPMAPAPAQQTTTPINIRVVADPLVVQNCSTPTNDTTAARSYAGTLGAHEAPTTGAAAVPLSVSGLPPRAGSVGAGTGASGDHSATHSASTIPGVPYGTGTPIGATSSPWFPTRATSVGSAVDRDAPSLSRAGSRAGSDAPEARPLSRRGSIQMNVVTAGGDGGH